MHWIALPLPCLDEPAPAPDSGEAQAGAAYWWALRFTPRVALVDGEALLLEVSSTERLWGGREALQSLVLQAWRDAAAVLRGDVGEDVALAGSAPASAHPPPWGCGPTALVAQARLRMVQAGCVAAGQGGAVHALPLHTLTALRPHVPSLERMGCRTWGALRALPRAGVARRIGAAALHALDQALGEAPEAHAWLELPEQFALAIELPALAESADALLWSANRCLAALQGWLQARQQGVVALELSWRHDLRRVDGVIIPPVQSLAVRTAQATQDMAHLRRLLSENLARTTLAAPANHITLRLLEAAPLPHRSASLLPPDGRAGQHSGQGGGDEPGEALHQLLERLSARLGADQVTAPVLLADHRPERMQQWKAAAELLPTSGRGTLPRPGGSHLRPPPVNAPLQQGTAHAPDATLWPTWLLQAPRRLTLQGNRPCYQGLLRLLAGPHRFEAGWWSTDATEGALHTSPSDAPCPGLALRDYFVAHNDAVGLVWVFRERLPRRSGPGQATAVAPSPPRWFLHGIFG
ncbi:DNA polymerase Y family protein [Acidovorax sp.]|uniref:DNA polymerase Y family protein n=1 Tax=Acidovorax sp. TaxID=1872122 RepID=UPI003918DA42